MKIPATLCGLILTLKHSRKTLYAIVNYYNSHLISALFSFPSVNEHVGENVLELLKLISAYIFLSLACSRLSDSGEDAKEKGTRKVGGAGKRKKEGSPPPLSPVSSRFIFVFALSQFSGPDYLGAWNRLF